jgi:transforming growth factor-beta-induced protein
MKPVISSVVFGLLFILSACTTADPAPTQTIAELIAEDAKFAGLLETATDAGLIETLQGAGPFTIFAPSNEAFAKLPTSPETKEDLKQLLLYHVLSENLDAATLTSRAPEPLSTVQGEALSYTVVDGKVLLKDSRGNEATVTQTDIEATNGVIHVIDKVLLLPAIPTPPPVE